MASLAFTLARCQKGVSRCLRNITRVARSLIKGSRSVETQTEHISPHARGVERSYLLRVTRRIKYIATHILS